MAKLRKRINRDKNGTPNGGLLRLAVFREAYHDALYAIEVDEIERLLRDPRVRSLLKRQTKELLQEMLRRIDA
jgi:hypothetical protein